MEKKISQFFINESIKIDITTFLISLLVTFILTFIISIIYNKFSQNFGNKKYFSKNFITLGLTTCIVITIVKSSLALSLGLVGALSIVRFRAAIKEPEELVYLFLVIATGLGAGANQIKIISIGIPFILILIIISNLFNRKKILSDTNVFQLSLVIPETLDEEKFNKILSILRNNCSETNFISSSTEKFESIFGFEVKPKSPDSINFINNEINSIFKESKIIFSEKENISL